MRRKEQIRRIETLEKELSGCLEQVVRSSRGPLKVVRRHRGWLIPGIGVCAGAMFARVSARNMVARGISYAMMIRRAQRLLFRWLQSA